MTKLSKDTSKDNSMKKCPYVKPVLIEIDIEDITHGKPTSITEKGMGQGFAS